MDEQASEREWLDVDGLLQSANSALEVRENPLLEERRGSRQPVSLKQQEFTGTNWQSQNSSAALCSDFLPSARAPKPVQQLCAQESGGLSVPDLQLRPFPELISAAEEHLSRRPKCLLHSRRHPASPDRVEQLLNCWRSAAATEQTHQVASGVQNVENGCSSLGGSRGYYQPDGKKDLLGLGIELTAPQKRQKLEEQPLQEVATDLQTTAASHLIEDLPPLLCPEQLREAGSRQARWLARWQDQQRQDSCIATPAAAVTVPASMRGVVNLPYVDPPKWQPHGQVEPELLNGQNDNRQAPNGSHTNAHAKTRTGSPAGSDQGHKDHRQAHGVHQLGFEVPGGMTDGQWRRKISRYAQLTSENLLRSTLLPETGSTDVTLRVLRTEEQRLAVAKQQILNQLHQLSHAYNIQEDCERRVLQLVGELERLRTQPGSMSVRLQEVVDIVQDINAARTTNASGSGSYVSKEFGRRCARLCLLGSAAGSGHGWLGMPDLSRRQAVFQQALAYAGGDSAAGEVVLPLSGGSFKGHKLKLKELNTITPEAYRQLYAEYTSVLSEELSFQAANVATRAERAASVACIEDLCTELQVIEHIFYIHHPSHFRCSSSWTFTVYPMVPQRTAALHKAVESLRASDEQLVMMWDINDDRCCALESLEQKADHLRQNAAKVVSALPGQHASPADYGALLDIVGELKLVLDECSVIDSVAISTSVISVLQPFQVAAALTAAWPHVIDIRQLHTLEILPRPVLV